MLGRGILKLDKGGNFFKHKPVQEGWVDLNLIQKFQEIFSFSLEIRFSGINENLSKNRLLRLAKETIK